MGLLTLLTDFGFRDHYVAALKACLLRLAPTLPVVDISHAIEPYDLAHAVHVLDSVFRDFPAGTVHVVGVNDHGAGGPVPGWHAARFADHYFVVADNGLLALLCDGPPDELVRLPAQQTPSPTRDVLLPAAVALARGAALRSLGEPTTEFYFLKNRQLRIEDHRIMGHVTHVDHYGNLITNISREVVSTIGRHRPMTVHFSREVVREMHPHFSAAAPGEAVLVFNSHHCLCIGVCQGNAAELLGLQFDSQVDVRFVE